MANEPQPGATPSDLEEAAVPPGEESQAQADPTGFLTSIRRHLTSIFSLRAVPQGRLQQGTDVLESGRDSSVFFMPSRTEGLAYMRCYFDHAASTYRFVDDDEITKATVGLYDDPASQEDTEMTALVLALMAIGVKLYHASQRQVALLPSFPLRITLVQIHLALTHFLLGLSRFQSAYLSFGTAARLALMLGLHRADNVTSPAEREKRRRIFWSAFMMDRHLSAVLGLPVLFDERDISQPYFKVPDNSALRTELSQQSRILIGSLANMKLSRTLGRAIRCLGSPRGITPEERSAHVLALEAELAQWAQETPAFFQPAAGAAAVDEPFAQVPHIFERQRHRVHSAYHFIRLLMYRSYLLDELLGRLRGAGGSAVPSQEVQACVNAAVRIAETAVAMQDHASYSGTFWSTAYFCFASLTVLFVYLMLYLDAPDRAHIEVVISHALQAGAQWNGAASTEQQKLLQESLRIARILTPPRAGNAPAGVAPERAGLDVGGTNDDLADNGIPFFLPADLASGVESTSLVALGATANEWETLWNDLQGMVHTGFDVTSEGAFAAGATLESLLNGEGMEGFEG
ncbi:hypothetical protein Rhopal_000542-T1 [Rhodotorula paludigena]|uniref:Xylanolytic transcriptional activator regulatory domain-containing protein n=1 Tax=Rhodotorula paludigena TaxID=86838 RepID=A0AAV5GE30_9BASI|nr:hypothetical protein Rhopal_000542-T1 [Rhodotorula paludigena]